MSRFVVGDAVEVMASMAADSVDLVVTSPPFLGLRDYQSGDRRELGHEASPGEFIGALLSVSAAIRRVLKPTGSLCVELGDTFADSGGAGGDYNPGGMREGQPRWRQNRTDLGDRRTVGGENRPGGHHRGGRGWPPGKSLCFIPELYAASLVYERNLLTGEESPAGEWRARNFICWARRNPTPGAVGDKLRVGTSYITIACPERSRYWDADAIGLPPDPAHARPNSPYNLSGSRGHEAGVRTIYRGEVDEDKLVPPLDWMIEPGEDTWCIGNGTKARSPIAAAERAHFAVWPEEIARRLIVAMCPPGGMVLDPFCGTGTTLAAAQGVGRQSIGVDIDARNAELVREKVGLFLEVG